MQWEAGLPWELPANVLYVRDGRLDPDWSAERVKGVKPCVAKWDNVTGAISLQSFSTNAENQQYGCSIDNYSFLIMPRYAPARQSTRYIANLRGNSRPFIDSSLIKKTRVTERIDLHFRLEVFNLTNSPLRAGFVNDPESANFGVALRNDSNNSSMGAGALGAQRNIQLGIKLLW
jgi:hypothetical protein